MTWLRGARCTDPEEPLGKAGMPEKEARPHGPKSPRWSAERRGASIARRVPRLARRGVRSRLAPATGPFGAPLPVMGKNRQEEYACPRATAQRTAKRWLGLFDIVS